MTRKSVNAIKAFKEAEAKLNEAREEAIKAQEEEKKLLENTKEQIKDVCKEHNIFCGIVLSKQDLLNIIELAITKKEEIKIEFQLYMND